MPNDPTHIGSDIDFIVKNANNKPAYSDKDGKPVKKVLTDQDIRARMAKEDLERRIRIERGVTGTEVKKAKGGIIKGVGAAKRGFGKGKLT